MRCAALRWRCYLVTLCLLAGGSTPAASSPDTNLGESIYRFGIGRDGREVIGRMGNAGPMLSGGAIACANCHGEDARGGGESFVKAPDIRWYTLSKPYGASFAGGAVRPSYGPARLARALRSGKRSDESALDPAMPRFDLADDEIAALVDYLSRSQDEHADAGSPPSLVLILPEDREPLAEQLRAGLQSCPLPGVDDSSDTVHPHRLPAITVLRYRDAERVAHEIESLARRGEVAAVIAPYLVGREQRFASALGPNAPPLLFPIGLFDPEWPADTEPRFSLPGLEAQARALLESVEDLRLATAAPVLVVYFDPANPGSQKMARRIVAVASEIGWQTHMSSDHLDVPRDVVALLGMAPLPSPSKLQPIPRMLLLPSAFISSVHVQEWHEKGSYVRVALPYPPVPGTRAALPSPAKAWTAIACELIGRLPPLPKRAGGLPDWYIELKRMTSLDLSPWLVLPDTEAPSEAARRVLLVDWQL